MALGLAEQLRQLGDIRRDPPGLIFADQLGCGLSARQSKGISDRSQKACARVW
jgi:hypothetical protein